jgi:pimeloyl-ACP methyl ester carboxylesterase
VPAAGRFRYLDAPPTGPSRARGVLVLLHAFPLTARMWEPQLVLAEQGWRVIAPQLRGFDDADHESPASSVDDFAGDIIDLLDRLHIHEAVIGGLSMGGYVALAMFRHAPRYFQGLVLADTRADADTPAAVEGRQRMLTLVQTRGSSAVADEMIPKLLGDTTRAQRPEIVERVRSLVLANSSAAIAGAVTALMTRPDSTPLLGRIHCPTLILVGDEDVVTPRPLSEALHAGIGGSTLASVPLAGHLSSLEQPGAFNDALAGFLGQKI